MSAIKARVRRVWDVLEYHEVPAGAVIIGGVVALWVALRVIGANA